MNYKKNYYDYINYVKTLNRSKKIIVIMKSII